ncbi:hypothetical protein JCM4814A_03120 [Streptomyces phaeofaciens JCM 4814]|uniref:Uncharacterized protein n=1 Tax=Streptomyces phaeofaciens TaxID=68254 RepID=A0A918HSP8_9ACTN|nr:hypothetical protein GCM10010226_89670 [Streptomyces phaeofaciens]
MDLPQVGGEFADGPASEGLAELGRSGGGRRDDEVLVVRTEKAGTASRPLRVQAGPRPISLKRWIKSRTVGSSACTNWASTGTRFPPAEASSITARRYRTELVLPRRTICCSFCPSW